MPKNICTKCCPPATVTGNRTQHLIDVHHMKQKTIEKFHLVDQLFMDLYGRIEHNGAF